MDSFQDLLSCVGATVFFSLLLSFLVTRLLLTMDSARDRTSMMQRGKSFVFDWICEEQQPPPQSTVVESPLGPVSCDGVLLDEFTNVEMRSEAYDLVELLNPEDEINVGGDPFADKVFDEIPDSLGFCEVGAESSSGNSMGLDWEGGDEDWEGVERSELEKRFGDAMIFVGSMNNNNASNIASLDNDDKLQLSALGMIVLQGPYVLPQLVGLKVSSRAKWNALQQLRHMNREMAMDRYISLLTKNIPDWSSWKNTTNVSTR